VGFGIGTNGSIANPYLSVAPVNLVSGNPINVNLYYMQGRLQVSLADPISATAFHTNLTTVDFGSLVGDSVGYVGFTGATGGSVASQQVSNFSFLPAATPVLGIANSAGGVCTLAWSGGVLTNMVLQQSSTPTGPWTNSIATPTLVGPNYQVVVAPIGGAQFFRLFSQ
jgi:hypothetical protein